MQTNPIHVERHGQHTWENPTLEAIRREECMCWHCARMKPGSPDHCPIAASLYAICVEHAVATPVSRCGSWEPIKA